MSQRCPARKKCAPGFLLPELLLALAALAAAAALLATWWALPAAEAPPAPSPRTMPPYVGPVLGESEFSLAYTDRGRPVPLVRYPHRPPPLPELAAAEERWLHASGLSAVLVRTGPPTGAYVCHDWVFTGGRYGLAGYHAVEDILQDNGYHQVAEPRPGDLAVYRDRDSGALMHTGVVRSASPGGPVLVESKWAWMGRYLHPAGAYYDPRAVCTFLRSPRQGHLLCGVGGPEAPGGKAM